jgi:hypothetical protein
MKVFMNGHTQHTHHTGMDEEYDDDEASDGISDIVDNTHTRTNRSGSDLNVYDDQNKGMDVFDIAATNNRGGGLLSENALSTHVHTHVGSQFDDTVNHAMQNNDLYSLHKLDDRDGDLESITGDNNNSNSMDLEDNGDRYTMQRSNSINDSIMSPLYMSTHTDRERDDDEI